MSVSTSKSLAFCSCNLPQTVSVCYWVATIDPSGTSRSVVHVQGICVSKII